MTRKQKDMLGRQLALLREWLETCTRSGKVSRNTIAVGIVVLHHLRKKCPLAPSDVLSKGGEIKSSRGTGLPRILSEYGLPEGFLKEVTTRQGHQDGRRLLETYDWGASFQTVSPEERDDLLVKLIGELAGLAQEWLTRRNLRFHLDRSHAPTHWVNVILEGSKGKSGGIVEQHLVGAKLQTRYPGKEISNHPAHAGDAQTDRPGDFQVSTDVYHVTASPTSHVLAKCGQNLAGGRRPILLVPRSQFAKADALAQDAGLQERVAILAIEDFLATNIIEMATMHEGKDHFAVLRDVVDAYNSRLAEVETDLSLTIELR